MIRRSSFFRIDENVYFTLSGALLLSLVVFAFRYSTHKECLAFTITAGEKGVPSFTNRLIAVKADIKNATLFEWDFGDGTPVVKTSIPSTVHTFKNAGLHTISLLADGTCGDTKDVYILDEPEFVPPPKGSFLGEADVFVNQTYLYRDTSSKHTRWEWFTEEKAEPVSTSRDAQIKFERIGRIKVWVKPNNKNDDIIERIINVLQDPKVEEAANLARQKQLQKDHEVHIDNHTTEPPLPAPGQTEKPAEEKKVEPAPAVKQVIQNIEPEEFGKLVQKYNEDKTPRETFFKYFCGAEVTVTYEGEDMTFDKFLEKVLRIKKGKIKRVQINKMTKDSFNCISKLNISIKKEKVLGIF